MSKRLCYFLFIVWFCKAYGQEVDPDLMAIKERLDSIESYKADIRLEEDISFIDMPAKNAVLSFDRARGMEIESDDFVLLPKRGLDLSLSELFSYRFITVNRDPIVLNESSYKAVNIIPTVDSADFSIALLYLDTKNRRVAGFEITTKEEGTFKALLDYAGKSDILPSRAEISFRLSKLRIPVNFMGKDSKIDRRKLKEDGPKEGRIILFFDHHAIQLKGS
jgi:hypothetical protein